MRADVALGGGVDVQVTVFKEGPQAFGCEGRRVGVGYGEDVGQSMPFLVKKWS